MVEISSWLDLATLAYLFISFVSLFPGSYGLLGVSLIDELCTGLPMILFSVSASNAS